MGHAWDGIIGDYFAQLLPCWVERRIVVWLRAIQTFPGNDTTPFEWKVAKSACGEREEKDNVICGAPAFVLTAVCLLPASWPHSTGWLKLTKFRWFWQLLGHYCSYLLPGQDDGTSQTKLNRRFSTTTWATLYSCAFNIDIMWVLEI